MYVGYSGFGCMNAIVTIPTQPYFSPHLRLPATFDVVGRAGCLCLIALPARWRMGFALCWMRFSLNRAISRTFRAFTYTTFLVYPTTMPARFAALPVVLPRPATHRYPPPPAPPRSTHCAPHSPIHPVPIPGGPVVPPTPHPRTHTPPHTFFFCHLLPPFPFTFPHCTAFPPHHTHPCHHTCAFVLSHTVVWWDPPITFFLWLVCYYLGLYHYGPSICPTVWYLVCILYGLDDVPPRRCLAHAGLHYRITLYSSYLHTAWFNPTHCLHLNSCPFHCHVVPTPHCATAAYRHYASRDAAQYGTDAYHARCHFPALRLPPLHLLFPFTPMPLRITVRVLRAAAAWFPADLFYHLPAYICCMHRPTPAHKFTFARFFWLPLQDIPGIMRLHCLLTFVRYRTVVPLPVPLPRRSRWLVSRDNSFGGTIIFFLRSR